MRTRQMIAATALALTLAGSTLRAEEPQAVRTKAPEPARTEFKTSDGVSIIGDYYAPMGRGIAPAAILLHMYRHDRTTWKPLIEPLHNAGFAVLAIDLRGHGESTKPESMQLVDRVSRRDEKLFADMHEDVAAAVQWIRQQPNVDQEKLVLVGASVGCSVAIDYTARDSSVTAVVCLSPGENYLGLDSGAQITKTRDVPILLVATEEERKAVDSLAERTPNAEGEIVGIGRVHGTDMFGEIKGIEDKIVEFLHKNTYKVTGAGKN